MLSNPFNIERAFGTESEPITFRILNIELNTYTHCGVLDFTAEDGTCYLPMHMFNRLLLVEGMMVNLRNVILEKGKLIKIRPHLTEFVMNPNPRTILENNLRTYVCVTKGDTITVNFNKKQYLLDVIECKPKDTISLTNVDVEVDFDTPLDYKEELPELNKKSSSLVMNEDKKLTESELRDKIQCDKFKGNCFRLDGKSITQNQVKNVSQKNKPKEEIYDPRKHRIEHGIRCDFVAFKGKGSKVK